MWACLRFSETFNGNSMTAQFAFKAVLNCAKHWCLVPVLVAFVCSLFSMRAFFALLRLFCKTNTHKKEKKLWKLRIYYNGSICASPARAEQCHCAREHRSSSFLFLLGRKVWGVWVSKEESCEHRLRIVPLEVWISQSWWTVSLEHWRHLA